MNSKKLPFVVIIAILLFGLNVAISRIMFSNEVNGLNYRVFQPDGFCYTVNSIKYFTKDLNEIKNILLEAYPNDIEGLGLTCKILEGRFLYPLLSSPFVKAFGINGMMIIPIFSYLVFLSLLIISFAKLRIPILIQILIFSLVLSSSTISRWYISNLTEPLLYLFSSFLLYQVIFVGYESLKAQIPIFATIMLMTSTKRSFHIVLIIGFLLLVNLAKQEFGNRSTEVSFPCRVAKILTLFVIFPFICDQVVSKVFPLKILLQ